MINQFNFLIIRDEVEEKRFDWFGIGIVVMWFDGWMNKWMMKLFWLYDYILVIFPSLSDEVEREFHQCCGEFCAVLPSRNNTVGTDSDWAVTLVAATVIFRWWELERGRWGSAAAAALILLDALLAIDSELTCQRLRKDKVLVTSESSSMCAQIHHSLQCDWFYLEIYSEWSINNEERGRAD